VDNNQVLSQNLPVSRMRCGKFYVYFCLVIFCDIEAEVLLQADKTFTEFCRLHKNNLFRICAAQRSVDRGLTTLYELYIS
jgi:hypothetical protein